MGILDDAIREHLELIRRHGATDSEVARLEDEAFGPPTRPDEPDFADSGDAHVAGNGNGVAMEAAVEELGPEDSAAHEDVTTLLPTEDTGEASEAGTGLEEPTGAHVAGESESEDMLIEPEPQAPDSEHAEPPAEEHAILEDPAPEAHEAPAEPVSEEHSVAEPEGATPLEPPIESLDTVEHPFGDEIVEEEEPHEEGSPSEEYAVADEDPEHVTDGDEEEDEDVLADTPEFLKDAPEDDELWFEQGEPKDFDF
jgi:hypothetical protein